jgi:hypothetical protein
MLDWSSLTLKEQKQNLAALIHKQRKLGFVLNEVPLLRLQLMKIKNNRYYMLLNVHHIIIDGWSMPILFKEVFRVYQQLLHHSDALLQLSPNYPYRNFIAWLQAQETKQAELFWRRINSSRLRMDIYI